MRRISLILTLGGALLMAFGWWGMETVAGRQRFDEIAGIIPEAAGALGAVLPVFGAVLALIASRHRSAA